MRPVVKFYLIVTILYLIGLFFVFRQVLLRKGGSKKNRSKGLIGRDGSYKNYKILRIPNVPDDTVELLIQLVEGYNDVWDPEDESKLKCAFFWGEPPFRDQPVHILIAPGNYMSFRRDLTSLVLEHKIVERNILDLIEDQQKRANDDVSTFHNMSWTTFRPLEDFQSYFKYLEKAYKDLFFTETIGHSFQGRPIIVAKVCRGGCRSNRPAMWLDAGLHGEVWLGPATLMYLIKELVEREGDHPELTEKLDWYFLPVANPDGYAHTMSNERNRFWHKNRSNISSYENCLGVDLNQNFLLEVDNDNVFTDYPCADNYRGRNPFSETEPDSIQKFVKSIERNLMFFNSIQSFGERVLLPWNCNEAINSEEDLIGAITDSLKALQSVHGKQFSISCLKTSIVKSPGGSWTWVSTSLDVPFAIGMDLRDQGERGYLIPPDEIIQSGEEIWAFHRTMANVVIKTFY